MEKKSAIAVIPSRYCSTRLPGKGLLDIGGKPMILHVYERCLQCRLIDDVVVAIDDTRAEKVCDRHGMKYVMTSKECPSHILRVWEVSENLKADLYVEVCGDEPMIEPDAIDEVCRSNAFGRDELGFMQAYTDITDPINAYDYACCKLVTDLSGNVLYYTRSPIPYPKGSRDFVLKKGVGIHAFTKASLDWLHGHPVIGPLERIEEIDELRFIEYGHKVKAVKVESRSISVDTPKDLYLVRRLMLG